MNIDATKLERQRAIARKWWELGGKGSFLAATGFGKSYVAIITLKALKLKFPALSGLIAVPSEFLRTQWRELLKEHNIENVRVDTIQSLVNEYIDVDIMILDELHSYTSPVFSTIFQRVNYTYLLGMTATLRENEESNAILHHHCPIFDEVTLYECLKNNWVSPFVIYNYGLTLSEKDEKYYKHISGHFNKAFGFFGFDLKLAFNCLGNKTVLESYAKTMGWEPKKVYLQALNMVKNMKTRERFLTNHPSIVYKAADIIFYKGEGKKIITFSQSIRTAADLNRLLNIDGEIAMLYHSDLQPTRIGNKIYTGKKLKNKIIERYKSNEIRIINTAKAFDQGVDIPDIDLSLVCSGSASILQALQRTGRSIRVREDKRACEINLFICNTQSEKWLRKRLSKHPNHTIKFITDINEIVL